MIIGADKTGTFDQDFYEFMCTRQEAADEMMFENEHYVILKKKERKLLKEIGGIISKEMLMQLDEVTSRLSACEKDYAYRHGFFDGIRLTQVQNESIERSELCKARQEEMELEEQIALTNES